MTEPLYCFIDAEQESAEFKFDKRLLSSPLPLSTVTVNFRHVDRTK